MLTDNPVFSEEPVAEFGWHICWGESLHIYSYDQFSQLMDSGTCLQSLFLEIGPFTRQLNRLICWPAECDLKIQTRSLELSTLAEWLGMAPTKIHLAWSVEKAQGHKARLANFTHTFTTNNHTNLALLLCSCGILRTRTSKRMGQQLQLLWELKQKKLVPALVLPDPCLDEVSCLPASVTQCLMSPKAFWYNERLPNIEGICWGKWSVSFSMRHTESAWSPHTLEQPTKTVGAACHPSAVR